MKQSYMLEEIRESKRPIVASVSGGKDSTAMGLWLKEMGLAETNPISWVFMDTGWEHPELYSYLDYLNERVFDGQLVKVKSKKYPNGMTDLVRGRGMFPSRLFRFCTQELKIFPIRDYIHELRDRHPDLDVPVNAVGIRAAESRARSALDEWEPGSILAKRKKDGHLCDTWRPLITWVVSDVVDIHSRHAIPPCPLYLREQLPASRVGCWPCIMSKKDEIRVVVETDPERMDLIRQLEADVKAKAAARYAAKGETFESMGYTPPTFFQSREGSGAMWPIDEVANWSRTSHGGKQLELFVPNNPSERGCQLWGLCDIPDEEGEFSE